MLRIALPIVVLALALLIWEAIVRINQIPPYVLPGPGLILRWNGTAWRRTGGGQSPCRSRAAQSGSAGDRACGVDGGV